MTSPVQTPEPHQVKPPLLLWAGAAACFALGIAVVLAAGLPDRASAAALFTLRDGRAVAAEEGALAPPFRLESLDGLSFALGDLLGQVVVLNFWATWCVPCQSEMPALQDLYQRYAGRLTVLGINDGETVDAVRAWRDQYTLTFPLLLDVNGAVAADYRLRGQPTTVIVAPDGVIRAVLYGPADIAALERAVTALLPDLPERTAP